MRKCSVVILAALTGTALIAMSGCAGWQKEPVTTGASDVHKMGAIEREARRSGTKVLWVNPPQAKERDADDTQQAPLGMDQNDS